MDLAYQYRLDQVADMPDEFFPALLFAPLENDFGDTYFTISVEDYKNEAVLKDPRFTRARIDRIRPTTKRVDRYLEWTALWDDYVEYLKDTYGSYEMAIELAEHGLLPDPLPGSGRRPVLRKGIARRMFSRGIVPSWQAYGVDPAQQISYIAEIYAEPTPEQCEGEEPDIDWALNHKPNKEEKKLLQRSMVQYRQRTRLETLKSGSSINGIGTNMDFIDHYYANIRRGTFDTQFGPGSIPSLADAFRALEDRLYWHEGQIMAAEEKKESPYEFTGSQITRRDENKNQTLFTQYLHQCFGVRPSDILAGRISKKAIKAQRSIESELGIGDGLTDKQRRKLKRRQEKLAEGQFRMQRQDDHLADVLLNNKLFLNNGTVRFEDMRMRGLDDDD